MEETLEETLVIALTSEAAVAARELGVLGEMIVETEDANLGEILIGIEERIEGLQVSAKTETMTAVVIATGVTEKVSEVVDHHRLRAGDVRLVIAHAILEMFSRI